MAMLTVNGITRRFGDVVVLDSATFSVREGETLGIIGPNGSGKTTLIETLSGLQPSDSGTVLWRGSPLPPHLRKRAMFYVPDGIAPYAEHSTENVLRFFAGVYRRQTSDLEETIEDLGLEPALGKRVGTLSKGYRRRLLIALGFITPQPLLLMDEPFDGFDLRQTRQVMGLMRRVSAKGRSLLLAIHQLRDAERMCDRFVLLSGGRVRGEGSLEELRSLAGLAEGGLEEVFLALA